jgi:hypothetical protein
VHGTNRAEGRRGSTERSGQLKSGLANIGAETDPVFTELMV